MSVRAMSGQAMSVRTQPEQWWALVSQDGSVQLRHTEGPSRKSRKPRRNGCASEIRKGVRVHPLPRRPEFGETVDYATGRIVFGGVPGSLLAEIKAEAKRRCLAVADHERQLNDLRQPTAKSATRFKAIDAIRAWSNTLEARALAVTSAAELTAIRSELA